MSERLVFWDVDTQRDFMDPEGALYVPLAEEINRNLARLTRAAELRSIPVVADADDHEMSDPEISTTPDFRVTFPPHCMRGTEGAERVEATRLDWTLRVGHEPMDSAEIEGGLGASWPRALILKKELDVFSNPNTDRVLDALAPESIVVYGVALDFCVRCVVDGLLERGVHDIVVVSDATKAIYPSERELLMRRWEAAGVTLSTTDQVLRELAGARVAVG